MGSKNLRFLSFSLGVLLLFHGLDKFVHGTEYIEKMLIELYLPPSSYGFCGLCMGEAIHRSMVIGVLEPYAQYVADAVYIGEVIAPIFLIFGYYIRLASAIIVVNMLVAIFLADRNSLFTLGVDGSWGVEVPVLYGLMASTLMLQKDIR